jgi:hypothetical protein
MPSLDADAYFQLTPLHSAAWRCKAEEVRQVLVAGGDVNARDTQGHTPLHRVAEPFRHSKATDEQQIEVGKMLLDAGADVNAKDNQQATPLHLAALWGRGTLVKLLLKHGSAVDAHTDNGWTPLHSAAAGGHSEVVQLLLASGANVKDAEAEFGGEESLAPAVPKGKYTPLGLALMTLQQTTEMKHKEPSDAGLPDMQEWRKRDITRFQAMVDLLRRHGGE